LIRQVIVFKDDMAQTFHRQPIMAEVEASTVRGTLSDHRSLALRRLLAWGLEVSLLVGSMALPWGIGEAIRQRSEQELVPLNPVTDQVQDAIAPALGLPRHRLVTEVPPLTNVLWFTALALPVVVAGSQLHRLARTGKTLPKAWLGLQVIALDHPVPGYWRAFLREAIGRWGTALGGSYLIWIGCGAFPQLPWLGGIALACLLVEGLTGQTNSNRRAFHDYLAGTRVVLLRGGQIPVKYYPSGSPAMARGFSGESLRPATTHEEGGLTALVLAPYEQPQTAAKERRLRWALNVLLFTALAGTVALPIAGGIWWFRQQEPALETADGERQDRLFLALVENLSLNAETFTDTQAAALALASTQDPRAVTLLVDLLAQTGDPGLLDTIQQALVTIGPPAIPHLQKLNLTLTNDVIALPPDQRLIPQLRLRTVKRTLAKILVLHSGELNGVDLQDVDLGHVIESPDAFTLVLEQQNLAGIDWRNATLTGARLRKARFFAPGPDGRIDTFDDWITDFSGADLTEASLVAAKLRHSIFQGTGLLRTNLSNAEAPYANFAEANASSARFIQADISHGNFDAASLVGADLTDSTLAHASMVETRLNQAYLLGAILDNANLTRADLSAAILDSSSLVGADLSEATLNDSSLRDADLRGATLAYANLRNADLQGVQLEGANLEGANFAGATFYAEVAPRTDSFITTTPDYAVTNVLKGVDFSEAQNLDGHQLRYICNQGGVHPSCTINDP
jgi:uncharacterized protein YjbI with pentapeptide repeats